MLQSWWELVEALKPYAKVAEYGVIFATLALGIFAARRLRESTRDMRESLDNAVARLKAQSQEMASELEAAGIAAIEKIRAKQAEDREPLAAGIEPTEVPEAREEGAGASEREAATETDAERRVLRRAHDEWWQPVVDMTFSDPGQPAPRLHWKNNVRAQMPWKGTWLTGWRNDSPDGVCGVALSGSGKSIDAFWRRIRRQAAELERELPDGATVEPGRFGIGIVRPNGEFRDDDERRAWIIKNLEQFSRVLGPRMKELVERSRGGS
jgi:hypothetical protein